MRRTKNVTKWTVQYRTNMKKVHTSQVFDTAEEAMNWHKHNAKNNWYAVAIRSRTVSTNDVPGARKSNRDELAIGCWAEHDDGSLIFVESTENGRAIYSIFDMSDSDNIIEYRDSMNVRDFKKQFSWDPKKKDSIRWTWHDKTAFPWEKIIELGAKDGARFTHADKLISAAEKVAKSRKLKGGKLDPEDYDHLANRNTEKAANAIVKGIQKAISHLSQ